MTFYLCKSLCKDSSDMMQNNFEMPIMVELIFFFLVWKFINQKKTSLSINLSITKSCKKYCECKKEKHISTLMSTLCSLDKDKGGKSIKETKYWGMISSLLYLISSYPYIMFYVCMYVCFQENPKESHLVAVKCIMRYIINTLVIGPWYPKGTDFTLVGFYDFDFFGCKLDWKSTLGTCHILVNSLVSWHSKRQASVVLFTTKIENFVADGCCTQVIWN